MIPDRDYYADKEGRLTTDATRAVLQVAVKGCYLDERVARRYGITDTLVSVNEPGAVRRVTGSREASLKITRITDEPTSGPATEEPAPETKSSEPERAAEEPTAEKRTAPAKKAAARKGKKK